MGGKVLCVEVEKTRAEKAIKALRKTGLLLEDYLIERAGDKVLIPVAEKPESIDETLFRVVECAPGYKKKIAVNPPSYDLLGDVAIVRSKVLEHRASEEVVDALLKTHPRLKAIYVKEETVEEYRVPVLKLLWGTPVEVVVVKEYGLSFKIRLGKVYYNPRLTEEHRRLASLVRDGEIVVDLFSGIGGFPVHIASLKTALVLANDLNPVAHELLIENIKSNMRRLKGVIIPLNNDARDIPDHLPRKEVAHRVIANLPKASLGFAEVYDQVLAPEGILHLYVLTRDVYTSIDEVGSVLPGWRILSHRLVLEYSPGSGIYRFDIIKPEHV
ncbi:methyltransferase [Thermosphaera chiliense]|uniref:Methyltransferase n=1 Tax=Thermosphaera chiliense TaxID=3402707 RepID=A0A7M1URF8_9CREN|nr:methyltransferase [Thermosphaera aggregans]QOR94848.1 methyltransferase [Thermosphaera aggregans]